VHTTVRARAGGGQAAARHAQDRSPERPLNLIAGIDVLRRDSRGAAESKGTMSLRARAKTTPGFGPRSIPARGVVRRLNTSMYLPSSLLAGRAPRRPRSFELVFARALTAAITVSVIRVVRAFPAAAPTDRRTDGSHRPLLAAFRRPTALEPSHYGNHCPSDPSCESPSGHHPEVIGGAPPCGGRPGGSSRS